MKGLLRLWPVTFQQLINFTRWCLLLLLWVLLKNTSHMGGKSALVESTISIWMEGSKIGKSFTKNSLTSSNMMLMVNLSNTLSISMTLWRTCLPHLMKNRMWVGGIASWKVSKEEWDQGENMKPTLRVGLSISSAFTVKFRWKKFPVSVLRCQSNWWMSGPIQPRTWSCWQTGCQCPKWTKQPTNQISVCAFCRRMKRKKANPDDDLLVQNYDLSKYNFLVSEWWSRKRMRLKKERDGKISSTYSSKVSKRMIRIQTAYTLEHWPSLGILSYLKSHQRFPHDS